MSSNFDIPGVDYKKGLPKHFLPLRTAERVFEMSRKEITLLGRECNENYKQVLFKPSNIYRTRIGRKMSTRVLLFLTATHCF